MRGLRRMLFIKRKPERKTDKYHWTYHVQDKMRYYNLSPSRVTRIIRHPKRIEEGIAPKTTAVMQPAETKKYQEIWVMYQKKLKVKSGKLKVGGDGTITIISAWRYPGKSPEHNPIPRDILEEVRDLLKL